MDGPIKTLFGMLGNSVFLQGVTLAFGEEMIAAQDQALPYVVMVPRGGPATEPGFSHDGSQGTNAPLDPYTEDLWEFSETFQFYIWAASSLQVPTPVDHAESARSVRLALLQALRDQRAQSDSQGNVYHGLGFKVLRSDWEQAAQAVSRFGRALILSVQIYIPDVPVAPTEATITSTQQNPTVIVHAPS